MIGFHNTVEVYGRYVTPDGKPLVGTVSFTPFPERTLDAKAQVTMMKATVTFTLDYEGAYRGELPASDDVDITPRGWTWLYQENFEGGTDYMVELPATTTGAINVPMSIPQLINPGIPPQVVSREEWDALVAKVEALVRGIDGGTPYSEYNGTVLDGGGV